MIRPHMDYAMVRAFSLAIWAAQFWISRHVPKTRNTPRPAGLGARTPHHLACRARAQPLPTALWSGAARAVKLIAAVRSCAAQLDNRFYAKHPSQELSALILHAGICAGVGLKAGSYRDLADGLNWLSEPQAREPSACFGYLTNGSMWPNVCSILRVADELTQFTRGCRRIVFVNAAQGSMRLFPFADQMINRRGKECVIFALVMPGVLVSPPRDLRHWGVHRLGNAYVSEALDIDLNRPSHRPDRFFIPAQLRHRQGVADLRLGLARRLGCQRRKCLERMPGFTMGQMPPGARFRRAWLMGRA